MRAHAFAFAAFAVMVLAGSIAGSAARPQLPPQPKVRPPDYRPTSCS